MIRKLLSRILPFNTKRTIYNMGYNLVQWCYLPFLFLLNKKSSDNDTVTLLRFDAVGDFIIWLGTAKEVRAMYPDNKICLVCANQVVELASQTGYFDVIVPVKINIFAVSLMFDTYKKLAKIRSKIVFQFIYKRDIGHEFVAACIPAGHKITIANGSEYPKMPALLKRLTNKIYDLIAPVPERFAHEIQMSAAVLRLAGHNFTTKSYSLPPLSVDKRAIPDVRYFVVAPGAKLSDRCWSTDNFARIIEKLGSRLNITCCICGTEDESVLAKEILMSCDKRVRIKNLTGQTTLLQLVEIIRAAEFIICNDTGQVHIAVAVSTPSLCIYGPWETGVFLPYHADDLSETKQPLLCCKDMPCAFCDSNFTKECLDCIKTCGKRLCINNVTVRDVQKKVDQLIAENGIV